MHNVTHIKQADGTRKPHPIVAYKATVKHAASEAVTQPLEGPVAMFVTYILPRPKGKIWKRKRMIREYHTSKPDLDNLDKGTMDALKGLAWRDDAQVCMLDSRKFIASGEESPRVLIEINELGVTQG